MKKIEKRQTNPNDIAIIEHSDFNIASDGENVFYIEIPNPGKNPIRFAKAFRAFGNVFIVPQRYLYNDYFTTNLNQPPDAKTGSVYDPFYLSTSDNKSDFLKKITLLLQRITQVDNGQRLLKGLYNGLPLKNFKANYLQEPFNNYATVKILDTNMQPTGDSLNCSLLIYGPTADCAKNRTKWIANEADRELISNGHGTIAEIMFNPDLFPTHIGPDPNCNSCFSFEKRFIQDPVVDLFHEMKHALHINYGSFIDTEYPISNRRKSIYGDELTIVSLSDREKIKATLQNYDRKLKNSLDTITDIMDKVTTMPPETKQLYRNKYFLQYDPASRKHSWTDDTFNDLIQSVRYATYETKFCDELNVLSRKSYLSAYQSDFFRADILNKRIYTLANGFNLRGDYSGQKTSNPKLIRESGAVATTIQICASRSKRSIISPNLCTKIKSDKMIQVVNDDYSDYKIVHTIDDAPLVQLKTENEYTSQKINLTVKKQLPDTEIETVKLIPKGIADDYFPEKEQIEVDTFSRYHILNAQSYDKTLDPKKDKIQFIDANGKDETIKQGILDNKTFYSYFSELNTTINTAQSFASFYLYAQWGSIN